MTPSNVSTITYHAKLNLYFLHNLPNLCRTPQTPNTTKVKKKLFTGLIHIFESSKLSLISLFYSDGERGKIDIIWQVFWAVGNLQYGRPGLATSVVY